MADDVIFDGSSDDGSEGPAPVFSSDNAAAWLRKDKNGDYYLSLRVEMGIMGSFSVNLFAEDDVKPDFNEFGDRVDE